MTDQNFTFLADVIDDLTMMQMVALLNYLALHHQVPNSRNIRSWRKLNGLTWTTDDINTGKVCV